MNDPDQAVGSKKKLRQAVVVIHGMGEQRPNQILRTFLKAAIGDLETTSDGEPLTISRPDKVSDKYDARRYQVRGTDSNIQTEFYEYHWAHLMERNKLSHLWPLIKRLMWQVPWRVPGRLMPFWWLIVILALVSAIIVFWAWTTGAEHTLSGYLGAVGLSGVAIYLIRQFLKSINYTLTRYFADVARYIDAAPGNQKVRDVIRKGLVDLLDGLHDANRYSRIIVVAHSLGSFIAYDAITHLWARKNKLHATNIPTPKFDELKKLEASGGLITQLQEELEKASKSFKEATEETSEHRSTFRDNQRTAWKEKRKSGNPWLVTDLFTFGSPLAHAQIFLKDLHDKQKLYELPRCPPLREPLNRNKWAGDTWYSWKNNQKHRIIYHAAPFAVVRWTNFWFPSDLFAGPLSPNFGYGIEDVELNNGTWRTKVPVMSHLNYFSYDKRNRVPEHIIKIRTALELKGDGWLSSTLYCPPQDESTQDDTGGL